MPPVSVDFTPLPRDYARAMRAFLLSTRSYRWGIYFFSLLLVVVLSFALPTLVSDDPATRGVGSTLLPGLAIPAVLLVYYFGLPLLTARRARKNERSLAGATFSFDDEGMTATNSFSQTRIDWGTLHRVIETPEHYLLVYDWNKRMFNFVPKRAFVSAEQEEEFRLLVQSHIPKYDRWKGIPLWTKIAAAVVVVLAVFFAVAMTVVNVQERNAWRTVGRVHIQSGRLLVSDPSYLPDVDDSLMVQALNVPPGTYPVQVLFQKRGEWGERVWRARVMFKDGARGSQRWLSEAAVDSGLLAVIDPHVLKRGEWVEVGPQREACVTGADKDKAGELVSSRGYHLRAKSAGDPCLWIDEPVSDAEEKRLEGLIDAQGLRGYLLIRTGNTYDRLEDAMQQANYRWGALPFSDGLEGLIVAFESGVGDGDYPVYALYEGKQLVGVEINMR